MGILESFAGYLGEKAGKAKRWYDNHEEQRRQKQFAGNQPMLYNTEPPPGLSIKVGISSGYLWEHGHAAGIPERQVVWLNNGDCCTNICVMGGIGSGKTTRLINPVLLQLFDYEDVGGLIFDIKGDFRESVEAFAGCHVCLDGSVGRKIHRIGVGKGCQGTNLLKGLTPEQAAGFLQSTFYLTGGVTNDSFWIQSATALIQNTLGLLEFLGEDHYNLETLYQYIFFEDMRSSMNVLLQDVVVKQDSMEARNLANYKGYYDNVFMKMDIKMRESIKGTLATILSPFQNPELIDAFSGTVNDYDLSNILSGDIVLVDLPLAKWQTAGKVIYTLIKLRFFNLLQMRQVDKSMPQNYVFFLCDEYQQIISASNMGLSDLSFWDKSRSAKCIGIISTQSVSAFKSAIGNPVISDTVMSNFRQKIFFKTEDEATLKYINSLAGRVEVQRTSYTDTQGSNFQIMHPIDGLSSNNTSSVNTQWVERQLIDANLVRSLGEKVYADGSKDTFALGFLSVDGQSTDDVYAMFTVFPNSYGNGQNMRYTTLAEPELWQRQQQQKATTTVVEQPPQEGVVENADS